MISARPVLKVIQLLSRQPVPQPPAKSKLAIKTQDSTDATVAGGLRGFQAFGRILLGRGLGRGFSEFRRLVMERGFPSPGRVFQNSGDSFAPRLSEVPDLQKSFDVSDEGGD